MSEFKISGCCSLCDTPVYEVLARFAEHERRPGEPKQLGAPDEGATKITFGLFDGTKADLTFCDSCAEELNCGQYMEIWRKVMRSWLREIAGKTEQHSNWLPKQYANGLLLELGRVKIKEQANGASTT